MANILWRILFLATLHLIASCLPETSNYKNVICVTDSFAEDCYSNISNACLSFECIKKANVQNSTAVLLSANDLQLTTVLTFTNLQKIAFIGIHGKGRINCNVSEVQTDARSGLAFIQVESLQISDLTLENCGVIHITTTTDPEKLGSNLAFHSSIYILNSTDVSIENVSVFNSSGNAIAFFNTDGNVTVINSSFENNKIANLDTRSYSGGGGIYVEFMHCSPGKSGNCDPTDQHNKNSSYLFKECVFKNNTVTNINPETTGYIHATGTQFNRLGRGGGMCIILKGSATNVKINLEDCNFTNNSAEQWGGGLYVHIQDSHKTNSITVKQSLFEGNVCNLNAGGGADIIYLFDRTLTNKNPIQNAIHFHNCTFTNNTATHGGGVSIYSNKYHKQLNNSITFTDCIWNDNKAQLGSAVLLKPKVRDTLGSGYLPTSIFENCGFYSNKVHVYLKDDKDTNNKNERLVVKRGKGAFVVIGYTLHFRGKLHFHENSGSAIYITSGTLKIDSGTTTTFVGNSGITGGAIDLVRSPLTISDNCVLTFINNTAYKSGGAINYLSTDDHNLATLYGCFIQYNQTSGQNNITFNFSGNIARTFNGHSIYTTSLQPCQKQYTCCNKSNTFVDCFGNFIYNGTTPEDYDVSTSMLQFKLVNNTSPFQVIAGKEMQIPIYALDELNQEIHPMYYVRMHKGSSIKVNRNYSVIRDRLKLFGSPGDSDTLVLIQTELRAAVHLNVSIQKCPPGFTLNFTNNFNQCVCAEKYYRGFLTCSNILFKAYIHSGYWMGYANKTEMVLLSGYCPSNFCYNSSKFNDRKYQLLLPSTASSEELDYTFCGTTRTGTLCGDCKDKYSAYYHSEQFICSKSAYCNVGIFLYILSELAPLTILFLVVMIFNISFTSGAANGFIFFAQVLDSFALRAHGLILFPKTVHYLSKGHQFIYKLFNLDFFGIDQMAFCLWSRAKPIDVIAFKYVTVSYALLLVVLTVILMNVCNCYRLCRCLKPRTVKTSVIHGLSTFLVMCYAQCTGVSFLLLTPAYLYSEGPTFSHLVVSYSGQIKYFSKEHLQYAISAIFCLATIVVIPPVLLLIYPAYYKFLALFKLNESKKLQNIPRWISIAKLKPLLDSFQSCYKDNCRHFAGLYFIYRLPILMSLAFSNTFEKFYTLVEIQLIIILVIHALVQPYKKQWHNTVDTLLFANLAIINGLTFYNYTRESSPLDYRRNINVVSSIQIVLVYLPMVYMVVYVTFQLKPAIKKYFESKKSTGPQGFQNNLPARLICNDSNNSISDIEVYRRF